MLNLPAITSFAVVRQTDPGDITVLGDIASNSVVYLTSTGGNFTSKARSTAPAIRVCPQTTTLLGMQQYGPHSVMLEVVGYRSLKPTPSWI